MHRTHTTSPIPRHARLAVALALLIFASVAAAAFASSIPTVTRQDANAVASAITIKHSDLPSYTQQKNPVTSEELRLDADLAKCDGGVPRTQAFAETQSQNFAKAPTGKPSIMITAATEIMPTAALAAKDLAATTGPRGIPCLKADLGAQLKASLPAGATLKTITGARLPNVVAHSSSAFIDRFTVVIDVKASGATLKLVLYADAIGFTYGQAEVSLSFETSTAPPPQALERVLSEQLLVRAHTAI